MNFPLTEIEIKPKSLKTPWFSKGVSKSSKTKQRLYIKFLKNKSAESEEKYKNYKIFFEKLKIKSKKTYYASSLNKYKYDTKVWFPPGGTFLEIEIKTIATFIPRR